MVGWTNLSFPMISLRTFKIFIQISKHHIISISSLFSSTVSVPISSIISDPNYTLGLTHSCLAYFFLGHLLGSLFNPRLISSCSRYSLLSHIYHLTIYEECYNVSTEVSYFLLGRVQLLRPRLLWPCPSWSPSQPPPWTCPSSRPTVHLVSACNGSEPWYPSLFNTNENSASETSSSTAHISLYTSAVPHEGSHFKYVLNILHSITL